MDDLLIKYILEEATPAESEQVQQWLATAAANRAHFERLQAVWQLAGAPNLLPAADTRQALQRLKQTLHARETVPLKRRWLRIGAAAAAVVGVAGIALGAYVWIKPATNGNKQPPVLQPDTVQRQPVQADTTPALPPVRAMEPTPAPPAGTIPIMEQHTKKQPVPVRPVPSVHRKKKAVEPIPPAAAIPVKKKQAAADAVQPGVSKRKAAHAPTHATDTIRVKKKLPVPVTQPVPPVRVKKRKAATAPITSDPPQCPVVRKPLATP
jgi:hypothetical protein